jgi:acyl carrier protein
MGGRPETMDETIRAILAEHGRLSTDTAQLDEDTDLYGVGLTSHATVTVMLALEDAFEIEVPDSMLRKGTFQSIAAMRTMVEALTTQTQSV